MRSLNTKLYIFSHYNMIYCKIHVTVVEAVPTAKYDSRLNEIDCII